MGKYLNPEKIIDVEDKYATVSAVHAATTTILSLQTKPGKSGFLYFVGNNVASGGSAVVTFKILVNGVGFYPYDSSLNQWADPASNIPLPIAYELPVSSSIKVVAVNSDSTNDYDATARIRIAYTDYENVSLY